MDTRWPPAIHKRVSRRSFLVFLALLSLASSPHSAPAAGLAKSKTHFYYRGISGKVTSARIIHRYWISPLHPPAAVDPRLDPRLRRAASIADERAYARTKAKCWRYVKQALLASGAVSSYPKTEYACEAGAELVRNYGFQRLPIRDPYAAPIGAVIVYRDSGRAGHVELRTKNGFASDYHSNRRCYYPLLAIYGKFSS